MDQVRAALRVVRKVEPGDADDFEINSADSMMEQINHFTFAVRMGVAAISSIALVAAGIGIMNIMLVSVTERTREIGIRRAIGAKKRNIMAQFIMEAIVLCVVVRCHWRGAGSDWWRHRRAKFHANLSPVIPVDWVFLGLLICSIVGIVFGTYPAYKAANLDPIGVVAVRSDFHLRPEASSKGSDFATIVIFIRVLSGPDGFDDNVSIRLGSHSRRAPGCKRTR